ncbi:MAG: D-alanine--D-alanine ligase [Oscillospiraceae bacterium]|nr:D-alanine--D-alanine ligase [Oscillospiraceae bacterium]
MKIVVLAGGISTERNVSLSTGALVCRTLREHGHRAVLADAFLGLEETDLQRLFDTLPPLPGGTIEAAAPDLDQIRALREDGGKNFFGPGVLALCAMADLVFIALHGQCGEDGKLQAAFDLMGIPYTGSGYLGSAIAMDKGLTKRLAAAGGVKTPAWRTFTYGENDIEGLASETALPCAVKIPGGGSSIGVYLPHTRPDLVAALKEALQFGNQVILEQYITGREFSLGVLEDRSLPSIEIIPKEGFYDYRNKYQPGATTEICPADIPAAAEEKMRAAALAVHRILGLNVYSRSDFILDELDEPWFLEVNTLPGMTPTSLLPQEAAVVGISYGDLCEYIIKASLKLRGTPGKG